MHIPQPYSSSPTHYFTGPPISVCPRKKDGRIDPYRSHWARAELCHTIVSRMSNNYCSQSALDCRLEESSTKTNDCLMRSYCFKNPFQRQHLIYPKEDSLKFSHFSDHWTEQVKGPKVIYPQENANFSLSLQEYKDARKAMQNRE